MQGDAFFFQLVFQLKDKLVDHTGDSALIQWLELDNTVQTVTEFRCKQAFDFFHAIGFMALLGKAHAAAAHYLRTGIGGHNNHHIAEVGFAPVGIGQCAVIHYLQ